MIISKFLAGEKDHAAERASPSYSTVARTSTGVRLENSHSQMLVVRGSSRSCTPRSRRQQWRKWDGGGRREEARNANGIAGKETVSEQP